MELLKNKDFSHICTLIYRYIQEILSSKWKFSHKKWQNWMKWQFRLNWNQNKMEFTSPQASRVHTNKLIKYKYVNKMHYIEIEA